MKTLLLPLSIAVGRLLHECLLVVHHTSVLNAPPPSAPMFEVGRLNLKRLCICSHMEKRLPTLQLMEIKQYYN
jgi:hypothetical protein